MPFDIQVIRLEEFVHTDLRTHAIALDTSRALLAELLKECAARDVYRVLIDARGNPTRLSVADIYELATGLERRGLTPRHRVAILRVRADALARARYLETLATSRGLNVRAFRDYEIALGWLNEA